MELFLNLLLNIIEVLILIYFVNYFHRQNKKNSLSITIFVGTLIFITLSVSNYYYDFDGFSPLLVSLLLYAYTSYTTISSKLERIFSSVFIILMLAISNFISLLIVSMLLNVEIVYLLNNITYGKWVVIILSKLILMITLNISIKGQKSLSYNVDSKSWFLILVVLILSYSIIVLLYGIIFTHKTDYKTIRIATIAAILQFGFVYYIFIKIQFDQKTKFEQEQVIQDLYARERSYNELNSLNFELQKLRHDTKHILVLANQYILNKDFDKLNQLFEEVNEVTNSSNYIFTGIQGIDSILNQKISIANSLNIKSKMTINIDNRINIDDKDLAIILGNMLDNAIENNDTNDKHLWVEIKIINEYLFIKVANTIKESTKEKNSWLKTKKEDKENHGYGILSIKSIVSKYDGCLDVYENNKVFNAEVLLKIPNTPEI